MSDFRFSVHQVFIKCIKDIETNKMKFQQVLITLRSGKMINENELIVLK